ncbi:MAG TPA: metallophosphoesterase [Candidatus Acidoferrum sp.]
MNWGWFFLRLGIGLSILGVLFLSQRFWYLSLWRVSANWRATWLRVAVRLCYVLAFVLIILATTDSFRMGHHGRLVPRGSGVTVLAGLWFSSALFAYLAVKVVDGADRLWFWLKRKLRTGPTGGKASGGEAHVQATKMERLSDPSRRHFFRAATALAGATPFLGAVYGFAAERLNYKIRRVEIPIAKLPPELDGMQIAQISDIHMSGYMSRSDVRRAVDMVNDLGADLAVVTGDFITGASDPLAECIEEVSRLRAPLGVWGCNGNHEIYARAEAAAQTLFAQMGMKLLRQENALLSFRGAQFNLIGVDYQRERNTSGHRVQTLQLVETLVRRDVPNILLSHNPNSFNRAAELGIELSLAGHTHGGQIQVEILDHRLSPARFMTPYVAGLFQRPLFGAAANQHASIAVGRAAATLGFALGEHPLSALYVNRGLGTVGAPVRLGVPPEISLIVLRKA